MYAGNFSGRRDNFFSYKHFGSLNPDNSRLGECHEMARLRLLSRILYQRRKINSAKPTMIERPRKTPRKRDIEGYE